jgi:hypothetical protein
MSTETELHQGDLIQQMTGSASQVPYTYFIDRSDEEKAATARKTNAEAQKIEDGTILNKIKILSIGLVIGLILGALVTWLIMK